MTNEWSLIIFSLLVQLSIGVLLAAMIVRRQAEENSKSTFVRSLYVSVAAMILAMIFSLTHLGDPIHAYRAITNVGASWLSTEIFFSGVFLFALLILLWMEHSARITDKVKKAMAYIALLAGIIEIYVMAKLYMVSLIPAWQSPYTLLQFAVAALILGIVTVLCITRAQDVTAFESSYTSLMTILLIAVGLELVFLPAYLIQTMGYSAMVASGFTAATTLISLRWGLFLLGVLPLALYGKGKGFFTSPNAVYIGAGLIIISIVLSRYLFYACAVAIQIGM